jgi:hypothetical protein
MDGDYDRLIPDYDAYRSREVAYQALANIHAQEFK